MPKPYRCLLLALLLAVWTVAAVGCVSIRKSAQVTVLADSSLRTVLNTAAARLQTSDHLTLHIQYGDTAALKTQIDNGAKADLLILGGSSSSPRGSYTFGSDAVRALMSLHKVDNYVNLASGKDGSVYSMAKLLSSKNFAAAQTAADFLVSQEGVRVLQQNGFAFVME